MLHAGLSPEAANDMYAYERERIPAHRIADAEEVAHWVLRLAKPAGRHATGQVITVDGGLELICRRPAPGSVSAWPVPVECHVGSRCPV